MGFEKANKPINLLPIPIHVTQPPISTACCCSERIICYKLGSKFFQEFCNTLQIRVMKACFSLSALAPPGEVLNMATHLGT